MYDLAQEPRPSSLVAGSESTACISVEELVEEDVIFPMWIVIQHIVTIIDGSPAVISPREEMLKPVLDFLRNVA